MTTTNLKFDSNDLNELFSSNSGNNNQDIIGYYPNLSSIDEYSGNQNTLKGTDNVGYNINGSDIVSVFHPIYSDKIGNLGTTTIAIPYWCNKIGFVLQASGGPGGAAFTNYWQKISIPVPNQRSGRNTHTGQVASSTQNSTYWESKTYVYNIRGGVEKCWYSRFNSGTNYGRTTTYTTNYGTNYTTNYTRNSVESATYYGSGGGGGGCCAGIYTIDNNARITEMVHTTSSSYGYQQLYFDNSHYVQSYDGGSVNANSNTYSSSSPQHFSNSDTDNTSKDSAGSGSGTSITQSGKLTTQFSSNGSNGTTTSGTSVNSGGASGYQNSSEILSHFMPNFAQTNGSGGNGSTNTTVGTYPSNMYLRYWFIR